MRDYPRIVLKTKEWDQDRLEEIGRGGEAAIYKLPPASVVKIFLLPDDPDYEDVVQDQRAALERHRDMQTKLLEIPEGLPDAVVVPTHLVENNRGRIVGYAMPFKNGMTLDRFAKSTSTMSDESICGLLQKLYDIVDGVHKRGLVIGDLNEFNVLVSFGVPYLIDIDSTQFGRFDSRAYTPRFTDPDILEVTMVEEDVSLIQECQQKVGRLVYRLLRHMPGGLVKHAYRALLWGKGMPKSETITLKKRHTEQSDWYSFMVIAMRLFTYTDPYGGTHPRATLGMRLKDRLTVFCPDVIYPQTARNLKKVPRPILEAFYRMFHEGKRFVPDRSLFGSDAAALASAKQPSTKEKTP